MTPAPVPPEAAMAKTAVRPTVSTRDWPAFRVADTRSVATDAFCRQHTLTLLRCWRDEIERPAFESSTKKQLMSWFDTVRGHRQVKALIDIVLGQKHWNEQLHVVNLCRSSCTMLE